MIKKPMDVLRHFEVRKTKKQKSAFIDAVTAYATELGYSVEVEKGVLGSRNIVLGDASAAKVLVTAHYDTPASIGLPNFITPCNPVSFIAWQLLILVPLFALAFAAGVVARLLTENPAVIFWSAWIAYVGALVLMMAGPANRHNANDNTSGVVTLLETARALPEAMRGRVAFVLFDLEEAGLIGSASYRKAHKEQTGQQTVLNLDCVGDGDNLVLFPSKKLKKDETRLQWLKNACCEEEDRQISVRDQGFAYYPSDQKQFPYSVGIAALRRAPLVGLYCSRIHTWRDKVLQEENVNILRDMLIRLIGSAE